MQVWNVLHAACCKCRTQKSPKIRHLGTIAQLCRVISWQLRHISTIGKKIVKQQCLPHMSSQYGELWPTSGWDLLTSLGHPSTFQRVSRLGSVTARHSSSGCQPNFAALNRGRHLYSTGRPSRCALVHILVCIAQETIAIDSQIFLTTVKSSQRTTSQELECAELTTSKVFSEMQTAQIGSLVGYKTQTVTAH